MFMCSVLCLASYISSLLLQFFFHSLLVKSIFHSHVEAYRLSSIHQNDIVAV